MTTKQKLTAAAKQTTKRWIAAADAALVAQGKAARARQRRRALKAVLEVVGKTVVIAGTAAATVAVARAGKRALRRGTALGA